MNTPYRYRELTHRELSLALLGVVPTMGGPALVEGDDLARLVPAAYEHMGIDKSVTMQCAEITALREGRVPCWTVTKDEHRDGEESLLWQQEESV